eukprot:scaffold274_cov135-Isochrysis_galbana.AAC.2
MNPAEKVDHRAFCTILPFRPGPGPLLTRVRRRTIRTHAGCAAGRTRQNTQWSVGTNLVSAIQGQGLYRAAFTRARGQNTPPPLPTLADETEADRWREVAARYGVTVSSGRMVILGCFDLHIARHIPPSAVKSSHYAMLWSPSRPQPIEYYACLKIVARGTTA